LTAREFWHAFHCDEKGEFLIHLNRVAKNFKKRENFCDNVESTNGDHDSTESDVSTIEADFATKMGTDPDTATRTGSMEKSKAVPDHDGRLGHGLGLGRKEKRLGSPSKSPKKI
jgi:hypothetical protein